MIKKLSSQGSIWLLMGIFVGIGIALMLQPNPSFASATDRNDEFAIATGPLADGTIESVYLLDFKTGSLLGTVMSRQNGKFQSFYRRDLVPDFGLKPGQKPKFIMATGLMQATTSQVPIGHVLYVAEVTSGKVAAYFMPYRGDVVGATTAQDLRILDQIQFRQPGNVRAQ